MFMFLKWFLIGVTVWAIAKVLFAISPILWVAFVGYCLYSFYKKEIKFKG